MNKKKSKVIIGLLFFILLTFIGFFVGFFVAKAIDLKSERGFKSIIELFLTIFIFFVSMYIQIIIHESGHLIFGLLTKYQFISFRISSFTLVKLDKKLQLKRMYLAGTGGQCLMEPPNLINGKFPYRLYNFGGVLMNLITSIFILILYLFVLNQGYISIILICLFITGFLFALINGIPLNLNPVPNDAYNALMISKDLEAGKSFWLQLKINALQVKGIELKDMSSEWFCMPDNKKMKNKMISVIGVFNENREMNLHNFTKVKQLINYLKSDSCHVIGLYENLLILDEIYIDLLEKAEKTDISILNTVNFKKFLVQMKNFPSVLRTQYAIAMLYQKDTSISNNILSKFNKIALSYPNEAEIKAEKDLIKIIKIKSKP